MPDYTVVELELFKRTVEEAATWLYFHNMEQSQGFADKKFLELYFEINSLEGRLDRTPALGKEDRISGTRSFPIYEGRFSAVWITMESQHSVFMLAFLDSKYPLKSKFD